MAAKYALAAVGRGWPRSAAVGRGLRGGPRSAADYEVGRAPFADYQDTATTYIQDANYQYTTTYSTIIKRLFLIIN